MSERMNGDERLIDAIRAAGVTAPPPDRMRAFARAMTSATIERSGGFRRGAVALLAAALLAIPSGVLAVRSVTTSPAIQSPADVENRDEGEGGDPSTRHEPPDAPVSDRDDEDADEPSARRTDEDADEDADEDEDDREDEDEDEDDDDSEDELDTGDGDEERDGDEEQDEKPEGIDDAAADGPDDEVGDEEGHEEDDES